MKSTALNNVDIAFQLLDGCLQQTEPLASDKTQRARFGLRIALELDVQEKQRKGVAA
jgi:hypothetical protein